MLSQEARKSLAAKLNAMIDVPMLGEAQEQVMAEKIIDVCLGPLESAAPTQEQLVQANGNPTQQSAMQSSMVAKLNGMIDIPFANEEQEAMVLGMIVDYFIKDKMKQTVDSQGGGAAVEDGAAVS